MTACACRPVKGPMCLFHFGQLPKRERVKILRKMGLRK